MTVNTFSRLLLSISAASLLFGSVLHALAFKKTVAAVVTSDLVTFYGNSLKALWLIDSGTLLILAIVFGLASTGCLRASGAILIFLALIPAVTAVLLYYFIGGTFLPAYILAGAAFMASISGVLNTNS